MQGKFSLSLMAVFVAKIATIRCYPVVAKLQENLQALAYPKPVIQHEGCWKSLVFAYSQMRISNSCDFGMRDNGRELAAVNPMGLFFTNTFKGSQGNRVSLRQGLVRLECAERIKQIE